MTTLLKRLAILAVGALWAVMPQVLLAAPDNLDEITIHMIDNNEPVLGAHNIALPVHGDISTKKMVGHNSADGSRNENHTHQEMGNIANENHSELEQGDGNANNMEPEGGGNAAMPPEQPDEINQSTLPEQPAQPEEPAQPEQPAQPESPEQPVQPVQPEQPAQMEPPVQPESPGENGFPDGTQPRYQD